MDSHDADLAVPAGTAESRAPTREAAMVVLERDPSGTSTVWCDPEIVDLVGALNRGGIPTAASCSGHGEKPGWIALKDGRQLAVVPDLDGFKQLAKER